MSYYHKINLEDFKLPSITELYSSKVEELKNIPETVKVVVRNYQDQLLHHDYINGNHVFTVQIDQFSSAYCTVVTKCDFSIPVTVKPTECLGSPVYKDYRTCHRAAGIISTKVVRETAYVELTDGTKVANGYDCLPGGYVIQHAFNKSFNPAVFSEEIAVEMLSETLNATVTDKIYSLESYRLHLALNYLDTIIRDELNGDDMIIKYIVNGGQVSLTDDMAYVSTVADGFRDTPEIPMAVFGAPIPTYWRVKSALEQLLWD